MQGPGWCNPYLDLVRGVPARPAGDELDLIAYPACAGEVAGASEQYRRLRRSELWQFRTLTRRLDPREEIAGELGVDLVRGWRMAAGLRRDLDLDQNIRQEIRAIYEDDCTFLEIAYTRTETFQGALGPDEGIQVRFGLRSLGLFGGDN